MASILQIGNQWRAQVRRFNVNTTRTFAEKTAAYEWAERTEGEAKRAYDAARSMIDPGGTWKRVDVEKLRRYPLGQLTGIYFLFLRNEIVYIGQSYNIAQRIEQHCPHMLFDEWSWVQVPRAELNEAERTLIKRHKPIYNYTHNRPERGSKLAMTSPQPA